MKNFSKFLTLLLLIISGVLIINSLFDEKTDNHINSTNQKKSVGANDKTSYEYFSESEKDQIFQFIYSQQINELDSFMNYSRLHYKFNGNILAARKGRLIYMKSFGFSNFETKEELKPSSVFQLASVSKQFTAMAIMILKEKGRLTFDDKVTQYFPHLPYKDMTIRHLLNHTSGLQNYMWLLEHYWNLNEGYPYNDDMVKLLTNYKLPQNFRSGTRFEYSNTNYALLAAIVEEVTMEYFSDFVREEIFEPLNMKNSFVYSSAFEKKSNEKKVNGYKNSWRTTKINDNVNDGTVGDKGVYSTVEDLYKWDNSLNYATLVSKETINEAFSKGVLKNGNRISYGFGFRLKEYNHKKVVYHHGLWSGFRNTFEKYIEDSLTIILLSNTNLTSKNTIDSKITKILHKPISDVYEFLSYSIESENIYGSIKSLNKKRLKEINSYNSKELKSFYRLLLKMNKKKSANLIYNIIN